MFRMHSICFYILSFFACMYSLATSLLKNTYLRKYFSRFFIANPSIVAIRLLASRMTRIFALRNFCRFKCCSVAVAVVYHIPIAIGQKAISLDPAKNQFARAHFVQTVCGMEFTRKLQTMFTDKGLSKDFNDAFREHL